MENYKYVQNKACEYYPCHQLKEGDFFNCLFCYCPLYGLKDQCGGDYTYTPKGIKSCMECSKPHTLTGYEHIQAHIQEIIMLGKKDKGGR